MDTPVSPATVSWLLPIAIALITAISTGFAVWATSSAEHRRMVTQLAADADSEKRTRRRERLEELYIEYYRWYRHRMAAYEGIHKLIVDKGVGSQTTLENLQSDKDAINAQVINMNSAIYFHDARMQYEKVSKVVDDIALIGKGFQLDCLGKGAWPPSSVYFANQLGAAIGEFKMECTEYLTLLAKHARELE